MPKTPHREGKIASILQKISTKKSQIHQIKSSIELLTRDLQFAESSLSDLEKVVNYIKTQTSTLKTSDHAFVRWMERVKQIPIEDFKAEMISELPKYLPDGNHTIGGWEYVIKDNNIITIK